MIKKLFELDCLNMEKLMLINFKKLNLNEKEILILLFLIKQNKAYQTIDMDFLKNQTLFSIDEISILLESLIKKGFISLEITIIKNKEKETLNIDETFKKIESVFLDEKKEQKSHKKSQNLGNTIEIIEREFGRTISPFELEIVKEWFSNNVSQEIIDFAVKEAVINNKINLKYMDTIIINRIKNKTNVITYEKDIQFEQQLNGLISSFKK